MRIGRRGAIGLGAAGALAGIMPSGAAAAKPIRPARPGSARNVIFIVVDGMSSGTFALGEMMRDVRGMGPSHWTRLWTKPGVRRGLCKTHAANGWVTDSAAAGSAWGIGEHVNNGAINFTPDGRTPEPILVSARAMGKATGLVTTTRVTHATPASFIANVPKRALEKDIAQQMLSRPVDLILGGGSKHFAQNPAEGTPGLTVVRTADELRTRATTPGRLLGLFDSDHMRYEIDRPDDQPSLSSMARVALDRLQSAPDGFVLQIEGGRVDHGAHANDAAAMIGDQVAYDETLGVVAEWAADRDDTLVVVTTDHGNANPGLTYYDERGVASFERIAAETAKAGGGFDAMIDAVHAACNIDLAAGEIDLLRRRFEADEPVNAFDIANQRDAVLGSVLANHFGVAFISPNHTADLVEVTAFGPGSEAMPSLIDNIDLHHMAMSAMTASHAAPWSG
jgi:alkaline phosphatase